MQKFLKLRM